MCFNTCAVDNNETVLSEIVKKRGGKVFVPNVKQWQDPQPSVPVPLVDTPPKAQPNSQEQETAEKCGQVINFYENWYSEPLFPPGRRMITQQGDVDTKHPHI